jgi:arylsulfatase A-like enzyme
MKKPNILLIMTDQHRLSALKTYDTDTVCQTPNINRLASEGVLFENTYTTCPVCTPARASVLTGEYPHKHGMRMNMDCHTLAAQRVRCRRDTLAHRLNRQGYRCGYNGKWHLGDRELHIADDLTLPSHLPSDVGFEGYDYPGHGDGGQRFDDYKTYLRENGWTDDVTHCIGSA